jgi:hypothetical protein
MIPYDNLFFAPSRGWATIAPIIFFVYCILNGRDALKQIRRSSKVLVVILILCSISICNYLIFQPDLPLVIDSLSTLALGYTFLLACLIFFDSSSPDVIFKPLYYSYSISFFIGLLKAIDNILLIDFFHSLFRTFEMRGYERNAFTFTEPSFISMHLYGVILFSLIIFQQYSYDKYYNKLRKLLILFIPVAFIFSESSRFILDTCIIAFVLFIYKWKTKAVVASVVVSLFLWIAIPIISHSFPNLSSVKRVETVLRKGVYADSSLASRYFRVNAVWEGMKHEPLRLLFGFGMGNSFYPFYEGYVEAYKEYRNSYTSEIDGLRLNRPNQIFSMPYRILSEYGVVVLTGIILSLYSRKNILLFILFFYLYLQFDSYAYYTLWLYIFSISYYEENCCSYGKCISKFSLNTILYYKDDIT